MGKKNETLERVNSLLKVMHIKHIEVRVQIHSFIQQIFTFQEQFWMPGIEQEENPKSEYSKLEDETCNGEK